MNILMMTNTYLPHVGGVARSVSSFEQELRALGHRVLVVAPEFVDCPKREKDVIRIPAIQKFNGSDFSVILPIPGFLDEDLEEFQPDVVHSHHPFLVGSTAVRVASRFGIPLIFTHHTLYEQYTHYVPGDSPRMKEFAVRLATGYCNLCDHVIAPSKSIEKLLHKRGVDVPITSIATGVQIERFSQGDGRAIRSKMNIPKDACVVGHLGRLAPEKNLNFLTKSVAQFLSRNSEAHFLLIGYGPSEESIEGICREAGVSERLHRAGKLDGQELVDALHAMDIFAFASKSETQGIVLTEAMASGVPVVALDATGAREVVKDRANGRLLMNQDMAEFVDALEWIAQQDSAGRQKLRQEAFQTAEAFSLKNCTAQLERVYRQVCHDEAMERESRSNFWESSLLELKADWELLMNYAEAAAASLNSEEEATKKEAGEYD